MFFKKQYKLFEQLPMLFFLVKWFILSLLSGSLIGSASALLLVSLNWATDYREHHLWIIALLPIAGLLIGLMYHLLSGSLIGSASALLLVSLNWATDYREHHLWIIALLPIAGLLIGLMYHYWAGTSAKGNNFLIEEIRSPRDIIPFKMAPLVYIGTVLTHLFGGSAGREGTGVQMGGAIADQFSRVLQMNQMNRYNRKMMVVIGISAGFASVFGTPLAGAVFGLEVLVIGRMRSEALLPSFLSAVFAPLTCEAWGIAHAHYPVPEIPSLTVVTVLWVILAAICFGVVAMVFFLRFLLISPVKHGELLIRIIPFRKYRP